MKAKYISVFFTILLLILFAIYYFAQIQKQPFSESEVESNNFQLQDEPTNQSIITSDELSESDASDSPNIPKPTSSSLQEKVLNELQSFRFSDDPYVELASLDWVFTVCNEQFKSFMFNNSNDVLYQQQQQLINALEVDCNEYQSSYPETFKIKEKKERMALFTPDSELGKLLADSKNSYQLTSKQKNELNKLILIESIKTGNSSIMLESAFEYRFGNQSDDELRLLLKSNDHSYINQMSQLAITLLSCEFQDGTSCSNTSPLMVFICTQEPTSCHLDFPSWYAINTLPGMKKDVETLIEHFRQFRS